MGSTLPQEDWTLTQWLDWQQRLHPRAVDLGLERVRQVWQRLDCGPGEARVITVAGTNGKGSCVAALEALSIAGGCRVGCYTSPHLWHYNERIRVAGQPLEDAEIIWAFQQVESARGDVSLSYFEFGTLAALYLFSQRDLDVWVLEVGLGGRLDAVNLIDADVAVVTSVGHDHAEYLGDDLVQIAAEKLAVGRPGRPLFYGPSVPQAALAEVDSAGVLARPAAIPDGFDALGAPGPLVRENLLLAVNALAELDLLPGHTLSLAILRDLRVPGRCELRHIDGLELVLDVAHNGEAAAHLAEYLRRLPRVAHTSMIFGALGDKPIEEMSALLDPLTDEWLLAPLEDARALKLEDLSIRIQGAKPKRYCSSVGQAIELAKAQGGRAVVWGSFLTVAAAGAAHG